MSKNKDKRKKISAKSNDELSNRSPEFKKLVKLLVKDFKQGKGRVVSYDQFKKDLAKL